MQVNCFNNMRKKIKGLKLLVIALTLATLLLSGCNQGGENQQPKMQSVQDQQQGDKVPEQLKEIETSIEKIIKSLDGPAVGIKEGEAQKDAPQGNKSEQEGEADQQNKENKQPEQGQQGEGNGEKKQNQQNPQQKDPWQEITPLINDLHYKWNSYMPMAVKKGADKKLIDEFSDALNRLTSTAMEKNKTNALMASSYLYAHVPDLYGLYKTKSSPEIKRIRHYTRNAMLNAMTANWEQADYDINNLKSTWSLYKNTIPKNQQEEANRLDFSIYELEKVVSQRSQPLTNIKGRVVMSNIEAVEKVMEKEPEQAGAQGQQGMGGGAEGQGE